MNFREFAQVYYKDHPGVPFTEMQAAWIKFNDAQTGSPWNPRYNYWPRDIRHRITAEEYFNELSSWAAYTAPEYRQVIFDGKMIPMYVQRKGDLPLGVAMVRERIDGEEKVTFWKLGSTPEHNAVYASQAEMFRGDNS